MKVLQVTAKTVEKAIEQGLKELGKSQEDVDIKILDEGGFFKKAKIELIYEGDDNDKEESLEDIEKNSQEDKKEEKKKIKEIIKEKEDIDDNLMRVCSKDIAAELLEMTFGSKVDIQEW